MSSHLRVCRKTMRVEISSVGKLDQNVPLVCMRLVARIVPQDVERTFVPTHGRRKVKGDLARLLRDIVGVNVRPSIMYSRQSTH